MYLHLGQNVLVKSQDIVGIFDLDTCTVKKTTKKCLNNAEKEKRIKNISFDLPKSFVVCQDDLLEKNKIFISPLATSTLIKRKKMRNFL